MINVLHALYFSIINCTGRIFPRKHTQKHKHYQNFQTNQINSPLETQKTRLEQNKKAQISLYDKTQNINFKQIVACLEMSCQPGQPPRHTAIRKASSRMWMRSRRGNKQTRDFAIIVSEGQGRTVCEKRNW